MSAFSTATVQGQPSHGFPRQSSISRSLVIGLLAGQSDYRDIEIATREGNFRVYGQGNSRPFELLDGNPERMVISFKHHETNVVNADGEDLSRPQQVIVQFFQSDRSLIAAIILDEVDYAFFESETAAAEIQKATRKYRILPQRMEPAPVEIIRYNLAHPLLRERSLRQALSYAIRRDEIKQRFFFNKADIAVGPFDSESRFFPPGTSEYSYNPKRALALLNAAGWHDTNGDRILDRNGAPLQFRIFYDQSTRLKEEIIRHVKIGWNQIGVDVKPVPLSASEINDHLRIGSYDAVLSRHLFEETLASLEDFFSPGTGGGFSNYESLRLQQAFNNAKRYRGGEEGFRSIMQRLQVIINEDQPASFLYHPWLTWHVINQVKFDGFLDSNGSLKPFDSWTLRSR